MVMLSRGFRLKRLDVECFICQKIKLQCYSRRGVKQKLPSPLFLNTHTFSRGSILPLFYCTGKTRDKDVARIHKLGQVGLVSPTYWAAFSYYTSKKGGITSPHWAIRDCLAHSRVTAIPHFANVQQHLRNVPASARSRSNTDKALLCVFSSRIKKGRYYLPSLGDT